MAHELDSQGEWQRLQERYRAMGDGELLGLAAGIGDLTETAAEVLRGELHSRGLRVAAPDAVAEVREGEVVGARNTPGAGPLNIFYDAFDAGRACDCLEDEGVDFELRDKSTSGGLGMLEGGAPVVLHLFVENADRERAMDVLRRKMGLFPRQEVEVADEAIDDGTIAKFGGFGQREEADEVARVLENAGIWHRVVRNAEGTVEDENCYMLEVREMDLMRAGDVVEKALDLPEE